MTFHEAEGTTLIVEARSAERAGLHADWLGRRIILTVHSDLAAVGFLGTVSGALTDAGISCNAVAALRHDHLFVAPHDAERALQLLQALAQRSGGSVSPSHQVIYTVRVTIATADKAEWVGWMEQEHLPAVMATGCFLRGGMAREVEPAPAEGTVTFVMEYLAPSRLEYDRYRTQYAPGLQQASAARFGGRFSATRHLRLVRPSQR